LTVKLSADQNQTSFTKKGAGLMTAAISSTKARSRSTLDKERTDEILAWLCDQYARLKEDGLLFVKASADSDCIHMTRQGLATIRATTVLLDFRQTTCSTMTQLQDLEKRVLFRRDNP